MGCADSAQPATPDAGAPSVPDAAVEEGVAPTEVDPHLTLLAVFIEVERGARADCRCQPRNSSSSTEQCVDQHRFSIGWQDCIVRVPLEDQGEELGTQLRCTLKDLDRINDCIEAAECTLEALSACRDLQLDCQRAPLSFLARVVNDCPATAAAAR